MYQNNLLIFVYGTLRRDCPTGAHHHYLKDAKFISQAKTRGTLFLIDYYPGLCITNQSNDVENRVNGEIYLLTSHDQLHQLDCYEGCATNSPKPHEYTRALIDAMLPSGETMNVWSYLYIGDTTSLKLIPSGDFLLP